MIWNEEVLPAKEAYKLGIIDEVTDDLQRTAQRQVQNGWKDHYKLLFSLNKLCPEVSRDELIKILKLEKNGNYLRGNKSIILLFILEVEYPLITSIL